MRHALSPAHVLSEQVLANSFTPVAPASSADVCTILYNTIEPLGGPGTLCRISVPEKGSSVKYLNPVQVYSEKDLSTAMKDVELLLSQIEKEGGEQSKAVAPLPHLLLIQYNCDTYEILNIITIF